jgi:phospholipase C
MGNERSGAKYSRREWLRRFAKSSAAAAGLSVLPASIQRALAIPPANTNGTLEDVEHVVILMQENRSFDHYFGTLSGVRGFGDRITIPLPRGKSVWQQSDGSREVLPFHLDMRTTAAASVLGGPHSWGDAHQAWDKGRLAHWPRYKYDISLGYYESDDIPFQRALASTFTICDAHHCSIQSGTLANRTVFMTGTNCRPGGTTPFESPVDAIVDNSSNRGILHGFYDWTTYPERLQAAGVSWRIYQDPQDNWMGLLAPWEAFAAYRDTRPGEALYDNAMSRWTLESFGAAVAAGTLPQVSWIIPSPVWSEHPAESTPIQGGAFAQRVLDYLTANPEVWSRTVLIVTFDEYDNFFDHVPPPAPPSIEANGRVLGKSTLSDEDMAGLYYRDELDGELTARPYGLGPRVPMYIVSPWSQGGWVCSEVFDHTSVIRFLEARFGVTEPNISAWHRAVSGDLTSCFDFSKPGSAELPNLPDLRDATGEKLKADGLPRITVPSVQRMPAQDPGLRFSRALPYRLAVEAELDPDTSSLLLHFQNTGAAGAVFHLYDRLTLTEPPHRFTVEANKTLTYSWETAGNDGAYDFEIFGPNGSLWAFAGAVPAQLENTPLPEVRLRADPDAHSIVLEGWNLGDIACELATRPHAYYTDPTLSLKLSPDATRQSAAWSVSGSGFWYDFGVTCPADRRWLRRFAGRLETGKHGVSDPAFGGLPRRC